MKSDLTKSPRDLPNVSQTDKPKLSVPKELKDRSSGTARQVLVQLTLKVLVLTIDAK